MIEEYLDIITNIENYVDGILVVDKELKVVYLKHLRPDYIPIDQKRILGKNLFEIYPDMKPAESTLFQAVHCGKVTYNHEEVLRSTIGRPFRIIDNTFPLKKDNEIIGAVCIATFPNRKSRGNPLQLYSMRPQRYGDLYQVTDIIGRSPSIVQVRSQIQRIAKTSSSVLIYGSTGTGKELAAQSIHTSSYRAGKPFLSQNCAAIPASLLESLFFGTTKGSFTGAEDSAGIFESANGGTVFLDEINSMDIHLQAKLLRVLEEKKITRVGSTDSLDVDVRIIAATNQPPVQCMEDGTLRADLFYRLGSVTIDLPDLKDRIEDIELLTEYFISGFNASMHRDIIGVSQEVMTIFKTYAWPGNVREFRNVIEGAFNLCESTVISKADLPSYMISSLTRCEQLPEPASAEQRLQWLGSLKKNMDAYEKILITDTIYQFTSLSAAADYLGISRQSLNQKMKKYNIKK